MIKIDQNVQIAGAYPLAEDSPELDKSTEILATLPINESPEKVIVGDKLTQSEIGELATVLQSNSEAFSLYGELGTSTTHQHTIELVPGAKPFAEPARRHPTSHMEEANRQVQDMLKKKIIQESSSPWASEFVMVRKKTGDWRLCVDYRRLNALTIKNSFPLPSIEHCLESLGGKLYYSKLDFASGYWQLPVAEESRPLTAFRTSEGLYEFRAMPFGLTNAPQASRR